jgi:hypothetical protein
VTGARQTGVNGTLRGTEIAFIRKRRGEGRPAQLDKCDSEQARAKQGKTGHGHSEETVRSEFFTHGTPHLHLGKSDWVMRVKPMWVRNSPPPLNSVLEAAPSNSAPSRHWPGPRPGGPKRPWARSRPGVQSQGTRRGEGRPPVGGIAFLRRPFRTPRLKSNAKRRII